jgi:hypothetical protein
MSALYKDSLALDALAGLGVIIIYPCPIVHVSHALNISDVIISKRRLMFYLF